MDFAESTEEIAPLTEEQKKQKLDELRARLAEKRAGQSAQDKEDKRRNEVKKRLISMLYNTFSPCLTASLGNPKEKHEGDPRCKRGTAEERADEAGSQEKDRDARRD